MSTQIDSYSVPPAVRRVALAFRRIGRVSFWAQVVLGVISTMVLLFSSIFLRTQATVTTLPNAARVATQQSNPGTGFGLFLTGCGLVALYLSIYWAFTYIRLAGRLQATDTRQRPKRTDVFRRLRSGLFVSLLGMLFTLLGGFAVVGTLVGKSFQVSAVSVLGGFPDQLIKGSDIFAVQGVFLVMLAHFIALVASLWLLRSMSQQA